MRVFVVSDTGLGLSLASRYETDGHDIRYATPNTSGVGITRKFEPQENWTPDIHIFDNNNRSKEAEACRSAGLRVIGPSRWSALLESDTQYRNQVLASVGLTTAPVPQGSNFYITAWFNGDTFISSYTSIVYRRFMSGGVGPDLACTGIVSDFRGLTSKTHHTFLEPLKKVLKKVNHRGCIHLHVVVQGDNYTIKDISTGFVHPLSFILYDNTFLTPSDILLHLFDETSKPIRTTDKWGSAIQLSVPPFPYTQNGELCEIGGIVDANLKHLWLADVLRKDGKYYTHDSGLIGYVTARGQTDPTNVVESSECIRRMYRTVGNIKSNDMQYRVDIGRNLNSLLHSLRQPGWLA